MNFEVIKARVKAQAAVAAEAARNLGNFDTMAANDDYIHHEDLRTPDVKPSHKKNDMSNRNNNNHNNNSSSSNKPRGRSPPRIRADDVLQSATQFSSMMGVQDDVSDEEDDVELVKMKLPEKKKNPNRFMEDLDQRLAKMEVVVTSVEDTEKQTLPPQEQKQQTPQWGGWIVKSPVMANVLSKLQSPTSMILSTATEKRPLVLGPLSSRHATVDEDHHDEEDPMMQHHVVSSSSSVLGAEEQAELERMRLAMAAPPSVDPLTMLLTSIKQNPQFAFIAFTLVLSYVVYFYSRHKENVDEVT